LLTDEVAVSPNDAIALASNDDDDAGPVGGCSIVVVVIVVADGASMLTDSVGGRIGVDADCMSGVGAKAAL